MRQGIRAGIAARVFLTIGALLPYWRLLTFSVVLVPDDQFTSDLFSGELPVRSLIGRIIRSGQLPLWTNQMCSGYPLVGTSADPLGLALFTLLPPAAALDTLMIVILLVAAHGTYSLARRFGANRPGAVLAGIAFAGSGYIATQLRHLAILSAIVWLPVGLVLIDRVFAARRGRRALPMATLGLVYANQVLAGFPQAAYISGLVYGSFALFRTLADRERLGAVRARLPMLGGIAGALAIGAAAGAVVLLPLYELASVAEKGWPADYKGMTYTSFWPMDFLAFFLPYITGDGSDRSYAGPPPFWEGYGYLGAATAFLAIYGAVRGWRRPVVAFTILMTTAATLMMLGSRTPAYYIAYWLVPGMSFFRGPTRFLVVVDLGLALLAAIGLTRLRPQMAREWGRPAARWIAVGFCVVTAIDLLIHQPRQFPMVPARDWLAPPRTADVVRAGPSLPRTFTPRHRELHRQVYDYHAGWTNLEPFFKLRDLLEPNLGGHWNVPVADCYVGLTPRWNVLVWGYHYYENSIFYDAAYVLHNTKTLYTSPAFATLLRTYGVTHVVSPFPAQDAGLTLVAPGDTAYVYKVEGAARVRVVSAARRVASDGHAARRLKDPGFDPDREILLEAPASVRPTVDEAGQPPPDGNGGRAHITHEDAHSLVVEAAAPRDAFLLVADTYYPGWRAEVDGVPTPIYRANVSLRGIALPKGQHTVRFTYDALPFFRGLWITLTALGALLVWFGAAVWRRHA